MARFAGNDTNGAVGTIGPEGGRFVRNQVPAADDFLQVGKTAVQVSERAGKSAVPPVCSAKALMARSAVEALRSSPPANARVLTVYSVTPPCSALSMASFKVALLELSSPSLTTTTILALGFSSGMPASLSDANLTASHRAVPPPETIDRCQK